jgi:subtilisin family serine protease
MAVMEIVMRTRNANRAVPSRSSCRRLAWGPVGPSRLARSPIRRGLLLLLLAGLSTACQRDERPAAAAPAPRRGDKLVLAAEPIEGQYVASLQEGLGEADAHALVSRHGGTLVAYLPPPVNAVSFKLAPARALDMAADAAVRIAEEDSVARAASSTWNLDRVDQRALPLSGGHQASTSGAGVHLYVIDTGVLLSHPALAPRADAPASFADGPEGSDCNGHGTHLAGIAAGADAVLASGGRVRIGVASGATIHSVRALDCAGVGAVSSVVRALDWVRENHQSPAVALVGLTAGLSPVLQDALDELVEAGVTVVGPAGNDPFDACGRHPAAAAGTLAVGATTTDDAVLDPSSGGRCVDLFTTPTESNTR